jgi:hypothetical protein
MKRKSGIKYEGTWLNDESVQDPRKNKNPVIPGK